MNALGCKVENLDLGLLCIAPDRVLYRDYVDVLASNAIDDDVVR